MITVKTKEEIEIMTQGGKILTKIMERLKEQVEPGIKTSKLNETAKGLILKYGVKASFKGYEGFPAVLCTSINEQIVHGIPSERILKTGDIISLDLGIFYRGFHVDMALTLPVGKISKEAQKLIEVTKEALRIGTEKAKPGNTFGDISHAIQKYVKGEGFNVIRELTGHGIGRDLHEDPQILNYGKKGTGPKIKEGMTFCIEPMVTTGDWRIKETDRAFETKDGSLTAHFEHTIAITKEGYQVLTGLKL